MTNLTFQPSECTHLEFTDVHQTISIVQTQKDQYKVEQVTYKSSSNTIFEDMVITPQIDGPSWSYSSKFMYAVPRKTYYSMYIGTDDQGYLQKNQVANIPLLPLQYDGLWKVDNPPQSSTVTFTISGQQRHATETSSGDDGSSSGTLIWGQWTEFTTTYTITITTNMDKHMQLIKQAVTNSKWAKNSPTKPF